MSNKTNDIVLEELKEEYELLLQRLEEIKTQARELGCEL